MTTQPKDLMTLEQTIANLLDWKSSEWCGKLISGDPADRARCEMNERLLTSALHHLEAGRKGCGCGAFQMAQQDGTDNEMYGKAVKLYGHDQEFHIGCDLPPISFCPWCGGKVPSTVQPTEEVKG